MFFPECTTLQSKFACKENLNVSKFVYISNQFDKNSLNQFFVNMNMGSLCKNIHKRETFLYLLPVLLKVTTISEAKFKRLQSKFGINFWYEFLITNIIALILLPEVGALACIYHHHSTIL